MSSKSIIVVLGTIIVVALGYIGYTDAVRTWQNLQNQKNQIENLNTEYQKLDKELDDTKETKKQSQEEVQKLEQEKKKLEEEREKLRSELQAKAEAKAKLAAASRDVINRATNTQTAAAISGNCSSWMAEAGVVDVESAYNPIMKESGCNPNAVNPYSGACGIGQQLPCGKWAHEWNDPVGGIKDMQNYVFGRYKSWANAWSYFQRNGSY